MENQSEMRQIRIQRVMNAEGTGSIYKALVLTKSNVIRM